jgi:hypothetical protein
MKQLLKTASTKRPLLVLAALGVQLVWPAPVHAEGTTVYRCPGNAFTNALNAEQALSKGCKAVEGGQVTIVHGTSVQRRPAAPPRPDTASSGLPSVASADRAISERVAANEQKGRDSDAKRILESELRAEQERLSALLKDYNNGEPERQGGERNYQKYQDRVSEMKAAITRKEADISAIKRELTKLGS